MEQINKYHQSKIYTIRSYQTDKFYIGSTYNNLSKRFSCHKSDYNRNLEDQCKSKIIFDYGNAYIELLENFKCNDRNELNKREGELIRLNKEKCVNLIFNSHNHNPTWKRKKYKQYMKQYYIDNKEKLLKNQNEYYKQKCLKKSI